MAYEKTVWKNREVERPRTFEKIENPDGTITLVPAEGNIIESGTPIIAENMNNIEEGIEDVHSDLAAHKADYIHLPYSIADGIDTYTTLINGIASLVEGMSVKIKFTNANTGTSTLNINGLGAKAIQKSNGNNLSSGNIKAGQICHLVYTGSVFQLLGEGGEYGTAQSTHVLTGYTFGTEEGIKNGAMPNKGAISNTITTQGGQIIVPEGYHDGTGFIKASFANLVAENIKKGVNIGGVVGTLPLIPNVYLEVSNSKNVGTVEPNSMFQFDFLFQKPKIDTFFVCVIEDSGVVKKGLIFHRQNLSSVLSYGSLLDSRITVISVDNTKIVFRNDTGGQMTDVKIDVHFSEDI